MGGRVKKRILNRKKTNLAVAMKKQKKMKKTKLAASEETPAPAPSPELPEPSVEDVAMDGEEGNKAKKQPRVNENRISRANMPLKVDYQSRKTQKANKHTNVIHRQPMSKKKYNQLQKAQRRAAKERERAANEMEA